MTTIADIKDANSKVHRPSYEINVAAMTSPVRVNKWLREIAQLEAAIRSYARQHNVDTGAL